MSTQMSTNRLLMVLIALMTVSIGLQVAILFRQQPGVAFLPPAFPDDPTQGTAPQPVQDAPEGLVLDLSGMPFKGVDSAAVALVEFSDYECPFCARHATSVLAELENRFVANGSILYAFSNFPLPIYSNNRMLATAAICAGDYGQYWEMHDLIFARQPRTAAAVTELAATLDIPADAFRQCIEDNPEAAARIDRDLALAQEFGLGGTPSFALGPIDAEGRVHVEKFIVGAHPMAVFESAIQAVLQQVTP